MSGLLLIVLKDRFTAVSYGSNQCFTAWIKFCYNIPHLSPPRLFHNTVNEAELLMKKSVSFSSSFLSTLNVWDPVLSVGIHNTGPVPRRQRHASQMNPEVMQVILPRCRRVLEHAHRMPPPVTGA